MKTFGRVSYIANASGLSWSGAKALFEHDRPPKRISCLSKLIEHLHATMEARLQLAYEVEDISEFLLKGCGKLVIDEVLLGPGNDSAPLSVTIPESYRLKAIRLLEECGKELALDLQQDIMPGAMQSLTNQFVKDAYSFYNLEDFELIPAIRTYAKGLLLIAKSGIKNKTIG